ncbi:MAG: alpha/beta hydrolase [Hyphomicrobium sp.]
MIHRSRRGSATAGAIALASIAALAVPVLPHLGFCGSAEAAQTASRPVVNHKMIKVRGIDVAYREAGPASGPVVLLLHGFPSSSHMFRDLIPVLTDKYRVIAPDYPGFGHSGEPGLDAFDYSFASLAALIGDFTQAVGAKSYTLYMQDYGGPVGFRLALANPDQVKGLIVQNATIHAEGWNPDVVKQFQPFWTERNATSEGPIRGFLKPETTKWQYTHGATRPERLSPDAWTHDQARLDRPGNDRVQLQYLWNYQDNVAQYPAWQSYLKTRQPPTLVVWGKSDPFFTMAGVDALKALAPKAEVHLYDAGHFALETHGEEIAAAIKGFLAKSVR